MAKMSCKDDPRPEMPLESLKVATSSDLFSELPCFDFCFFRGSLDVSTTATGRRRFFEESVCVRTCTNFGFDEARFFLFFFDNEDEERLAFAFPLDANMSSISDMGTSSLVNVW